MTLYQPESGYCYNSDSLYLYKFIDSFHPRGRMLDVGAGCGVVGLLVARDNQKVELHAVEKQEIFVKYAEKNAKANEINYNIHHMDFLEYEDEKGFDYIISNPPFYHEGASKSEDEMLYHARYNVNLPLKQFFGRVAKLLTPKGHFIFCYDAKQFAIICALLSEAKLRVVDVQFVHSKIDRSASLVMLHVRKNSKSLLNVLPPFIAFDGDRFSKASESVYEKAGTNSIKCQI
ncbi:methyltransferase [Sulfurimonas sp. HSL-1716]|uniref:tRNA1(Val) (adenine(37)-N6)-methyltransferase n=1 Tax=Hydrocurvibacter sulfurireducens TaxID=3131937 RepID=UPI0031F963BD